MVDVMGGRNAEGRDDQIQLQVRKTRAKVAAARKSLTTLEETS